MTNIQILAKINPEIRNGIFLFSNDEVELAMDAARKDSFIKSLEYIEKMGIAPYNGGWIFMTKQAPPMTPEELYQLFKQSKQ